MNRSLPIPFFVAGMLAVVVILGSTRGGAAQAPKATIIEFGRYKATIVGLLETFRETPGAVDVVAKGHTHIEATKIIPCKVGETWGYRVKWENLPRSPYLVRTEVHHPPIRQPNGKVLTRAVNEWLMTPRVPLQDLIINWYFLQGLEYELVPGEWTKKIFINGVEVVSMTFVVQK